MTISLRRPSSNQLAVLQARSENPPSIAQGLKAPDASDGPPDVRSTFKKLVMESVTPTESLVPDEPPGLDCVRDQATFPNVKFFTQREWNEYKRNNGKSTRISEEIIRGRKKSAQGENHTALYIEHIDGTPADGDYINDARKFAHQLISLAISTNYTLPKKWREADVWFQELFYSALRKRFPLFQLCHNNAKGNLFMTHTYYETVTRKWENIRPPGVTLNDAKYTLPNLSDNEESPDDAHDGPDDNRPRPPSPRPSSKRPADAVIASQKPPQRARVRAQDPQGDPSSPRPDKGKQRAGQQRAGPSLLSLISTSMTPLQPSPRVPECLTAPSAAGLAPGQSLDLTAPPVSLPSASPSSLTLVPSDNHPSSSHVDHPALPIPQTPSQPPASPSLVLRPPADVSEAPPVSSDVPVSVGDSVADVASESVAATSSHVPPTQNLPASKKPRPPRKAPQWPPPSELRGTKWAYARHWYKENAGTEAEFEKHYKAMSPTDRKKAARDCQQ
ncbi:hypothetical protein BD311DRAFT_669285 [Dichomitus squalens]|uniref:Uncharacterized protein n=1 Tax=Dichomitus squalens TaxID=114155 RepID=A0A4V2JZL8_9APHY|nr:hypothetical protein BD311DRAFT_669285 [Dichomitus squalens]